MVSLVFGSLIYLVIAIRWGNQPYRWEHFYILPAGMGMGAILTCTFVGMTMSTPKRLHATAICIYFLCQQVGGIIGTAVSSVTLRTIFKNTLEDWLNGIPNKEEVGGRRPKSGLTQSMLTIIGNSGDSQWSRVVECSRNTSKGGSSKLSSQLPIRCK